MRLQIQFIGRVQGVGFRATALQIARQHPVTGWVQNQPDGSVLLEAQGDASAVDAVLDELRIAMHRYIRAENRLAQAEVSGEVGFHIR